jgi:hypothetical protein
MQQGMAPIVPMHEPRVLTARVVSCCLLCATGRAKLTHASIPAVSTLIALARKSLSIARLEILSSRRLDVDHGVVTAAWCMSWTESTVQRRLRWTTVGIVLSDIEIGRHDGGYLCDGWGSKKYRANKRGRRFEVVCEECGRELGFKQSDEVR